MVCIYLGYKIKGTWREYQMKFAFAFFVLVMENIKCKTNLSFI